MFRLLVLFTCCVVLCVAYKEEPNCKENEEWSDCKRSCLSVIRFSCDVSLPCEEGCACKNGHLRISPGSSCIPICQCPQMKHSEVCKPEVCPANERYSTCIQAECRALNCTEKDQPVVCVRMDPAFCKKGCVCKEGYLRHKDGICVLEDKCKPRVCPANERRTTCIQAECRAQRCTQKDKPVLCARIDPAYCKNGCVCENGYLRDEDGICVLEDKCKPAPSCTSANEEFVPCMQGVCRAKDCSQKGENVPCPDIPAEGCTSGCICKKHFLRAANGSCVPGDQCEQPTCPGENEMYTDCKESCPPEVCFSIQAFYDCSNAEPCTKGCACKPGYLRKAMDSPCIPTCKCPQMVNEEHCKAKA